MNSLAQAVAVGVRSGGGQTKGERMYKVVLVPAGCCQSALDVRLVEQNANQMAAAGYELSHVYETSSAGCCVGKKTSAVLVFKQRQ